MSIAQQIRRSWSCKRRFVILVEKWIPLSKCGCNMYLKFNVIPSVSSNKLLHTIVLAVNVLANSIENNGCHGYISALIRRPLFRVHLLTSYAGCFCPRITVFHSYIPRFRWADCNLIPPLIMFSEGNLSVEVVTPAGTSSLK